MKDQELRDILHGYRPQIDDNEAFMDKLMAQMDAVDEKQQQTRIIPLYRKVLPWVAGVAAAVVVAVFVIKEPATPSAEMSYQSRLPEYYYRTPSPSDFSSYEDVVDEIERSGRQLENIIAQL